MGALKSIVLAFAVFSRIPVPQVEFRKENMGGLMVAFPLVGLVTGLVILLWDALCGGLNLGALARGVGYALLPVALNGGIHMDGFCDTVDALASHGDPETRQRILRDPHIGSFAALALCAYVLTFTALGAEAAFSRRQLMCLALAFVLSRTVAGIAILAFPGAPDSSLGKQFQSAARKPCLRLLTLTLVGLGLAMTGLGAAAGLVAFLLPLLLLARWKRRAARQFGGMSGDLAGYLIQMGELSSLASLVLVPRLF